MSEQLIATPGTFGENGNFLLERELGRGGMGGVYMGRDKMLDRPVAVKVMLKEYGADPEFVEKFKKEAQAAAKLIHPNIAQIYSYGISDGMPYIAMELVAGGSLWGIMKNSPGGADVPRVMKICQQVAQALQCSSDQGYVHGDIKPENVLLDANGNAKLVDFGLAGMQKNTDEIWGTPYYIAPEKVRQELVDYRADMYNLGGTLYHALTGKPPFDGDDVNDVVKARFMGPPKKPSELRPELSPQIDALVMKMLALDKADRFPSFEALIEEFKKVMTTGLESQTGRIPAPGTGTTARPGGSRKIVMRGGRRMTTVRRPLSTAAAAGGVQAGGSSGAAEADAERNDDDDEEEGGNLGLKVAGAVLGGILLIGAVIGGLVWYKVAAGNSRERERQAQIERNIGVARTAIEDTRRTVVKFAAEVEDMGDKALEAGQLALGELKGHLPDFADLLSSAPTKELKDAIASTNAPLAAVATPPAAPAAATNAPPAAPAAATNAPPAAPAAATNAPPAAVKAEAGEAKAAAEGVKPAEEKPRDVPSSVGSMMEIWARACSCKASSVKIIHQLRKVVELCDTAAAIKGATEAEMQSLSKLSRDVTEMFGEIKASKEMDNLRSNGPKNIADRAKKQIASAVKQMRIEKLERDRAAAKAAAAEAEKKRLEEAAAEKARLVEAETAAARDKFDAIVAQGSIRQLDWKTALRLLEGVKSEARTPEGGFAADAEMRKVNAMKAVHDLFRKNLPGYTFKKSKLKGCAVKSADEGEICVVRPDGKTQTKIMFSKFYQNYPGNFNEAIRQFIEGGRENCRPRLNLRDWAEAMSGAALTMRLVCGEVPGAIEKSEAMVKKTVELFPDYGKTAAEMFPDILSGEAGESSEGGEE